VSSLVEYLPQRGGFQVDLAREWVIKASKFCNLRCKYCYEWTELGERERMSLSLWAKILDTIRELSERTERATGLAPTDAIVWHGGEPTALPKSYLEDVVRLQREKFPQAWFESGRIKNRIQTNLYALSDDKLEFLKRNDFGIGVSFDVVPGARLDTRGAPTEERVLANVRRLEADGITPKFLVVIAAHTAQSIDHVYEFLREHGQPCRLLPLFDGPAERPLDGVAADRATINLALMHMFRRWFEDDCPFPIRLFDEYLTVVVLKMLGLARGFRYDRRMIGDKILVVNLDGRVYQPCTDYSDEFALGNLSSQSIDEIFASARYDRSLERDDEIRRAVCEPCEYFGACGAKEMFMVNDGGASQRRCMTAQPLFRAIEQYLREQGVNARMLSSYVPDALQELGYSGSDQPEGRLPNGSRQSSPAPCQA
jgi:uncharacterized protein